MDWSLGVTGATHLLGVPSIITCAILEANDDTCIKANARWSQP